MLFYDLSMCVGLRRLRVRIVLSDAGDTEQTAYAPVSTGTVASSCQYSYHHSHKGYRDTYIGTRLKASSVIEKQSDPRKVNTLLLAVTQKCDHEVVCMCAIV
jgi:hypothetical protein